MNACEASSVGGIDFAATKRASRLKLTAVDATARRKHFVCATVLCVIEASNEPLHPSDTVNSDGSPKKLNASSH